MWRILLALFLLVGFSLPLQAAPTEVVAPAYGECRDMNGKPVRYIGVSARKFRSMGIMTAFATTSPGRKVIYDRDSLSLMPEQFQQMVLWHECGHYVLGHLHPAAFNSTSPKVVQERERAADCYAAKMMVGHLGYDEADIEVATSTLRHMDRVFMGISITHDRPSDRADIVEACAK